LHLVGSTTAFARVRIKTNAHEEERDVEGESVFALPFNASHVAVHWQGNHDALVQVAFDTGAGFGVASTVLHDEVGEHKNDGRTYGAVMAAGTARAVRVITDRPLPRLRVLAMVDGERTVTHETGSGVLAAPNMPAVISRAGWGCDESLMTWPPQFYPIQKLITHHTATQNRDPDPPATIRSIYYYHAVTQAWGDIGYNFLVDESGRIYEGRYSRPYPVGTYPNGEDAAGQGVTGAHAYQFNSGTVGIALLGTLTSQDTTPAGRSGIENMLAWKASTHGIDPKGSNRYTNPVTGVSTTFANIAGHRDVNATECPGGVFYQNLPIVRTDVAAMISGTPTPSATPSQSPSPTATPSSSPSPTPTPKPTPKPSPKPKPSPSPTPSDQGGGNH
jgi:cell division septation protein DedD